MIAFSTPVGDTPSIRVNRVGVEGRTIYVKAEFFNPAASVKDRLALNIIEEGERSGALKPGQTVVEASSGNTGIGLAMVCAQKGYPLVVTMADSFSIERRKLMRMLGAKVVLTPRAQKGIGMYKKAVELAKPMAGSSRVNSRPRPTLPFMRRRRRAKSSMISPDKRLDCFVTGYGTGGTVAGVGKCPAPRAAGTPIVLCEPANAQLVGSGKPQERGRTARRRPSHPAWEPHPIQGWTPDFIPAVLQEAIDRHLYDELVPIAGAEGMTWAKALAQKEGIFTGVSGGSTFAVARTVARAAPAGSVILCMLPDTGERYLSTPLFEDIETEMTEEETGSCRARPHRRSFLRHEPD